MGTMTRGEEFRHSSPISTDLPLLELLPTKAPGHKGEDLERPERTIRIRLATR